MRKIFKKPLVYLLAFMMLTPTWLVTGIFNAPHAQAADNGPSLLVYTVSNSVISPNNDGKKDSTIIDLDFSEEVSVNFDIINSSGADVLDFYNPSDTVTNPNPRVWNGKDKDGNILPDGIYTLKISYTGSLDQMSVVDTSKTVTIDTSAPTLTNISFQSQLNQGTSVDLTTDASGNFLLPIDNNDADVYSLQLSIGAVSSEELQQMAGEPNVYSKLKLNGINFAYLYSENGINWQLINIDAYDDPINSEIVAPVITGDLHTGDYSLTGEIADLAGNSTNLGYAFKINHVETVLPNDNKIPFGNNSNFDLTYPSAGGMIDLSNFSIPGNGKQVKTGGEITVHSITANGEVDIVIPAGTTMEGPSTWDSVLNLPTEVTPAASLPVASAGSYYSSDNSIEIGSTAGFLVFSNPVQITFAGKAGESAGFIGSNTFFPIAEVCDSTTVPTTFSSSGECKIDSGSNLIVWTKHFTNFVTYKQIAVTAPAFSVSDSVKSGIKTITVSWSGVGANLGDSYIITVNGVTQTVPAVANDLNQSYSKDISVNDFGKYSVLVQSKINNALSLNTTTQVVSFTAPAPAPISPQKAEAAAPSTSSQSVTAPSTTPSTPASDNNGQIKGDETQSSDTSNNSINWTPWIVLFVLILLAGAATGGYFYWFGGEEEVKAVVKEPKKTVTPEPPIRKVENQTKKQNKKSKRW